MISVANATAQITGITASARTAWHLTEAAGMIRTDREVEDQFMANKWDATPWDHFYGSGGNPADAWIMFDLGAEYDLDEIRLWNANISHVNDGLFGWYAKNMSIHVAGEGAVLPSMADGMGEYFTDPSWTSIWDDDLAQGVWNISEDSLVDPQLILDATGNNNVRYIAIDIDSRYDDANAPALLGHIQIYEVSKIANISAIRTGLDFVEFEVTDVGESELLPGTINLTIDGTNVTDELTVTKIGDVTTVRHDEVPQFTFDTTINYLFAAEDKLGQMIQLNDNFMIEAPFADNQITGITASARNAWHLTEAAGMIRTDREVEDQFMANKWDTTPWDHFYGNDGNPADAWIMFDLGAGYDLDEIKLWNGNVAHGDAGLMGWNTKNMSMYVASADAVLPSPDEGLGEYFTDPSWTSVFDGDLAQGPGGTALAQDQLVDPQLVLDAIGNKSVRYIAIDIDSRYDDANGPALLGHIQIYGVPETAFTLAITEISYDKASEQVTLTWTSRPNRTYAVLYSNGEILNFVWDVDDSVASAGDTTSLTFSNPAPGARKVFFRISENGP